MGYVVWMPVQAKGSWLGEGDDFTFMNMPANGLRAWRSRAYGGWGRRQVGKQVVDPYAFPAGDTSQQAMVSALGSLNKKRVLIQVFPWLRKTILQPGLNGL